MASAADAGAEVNGHCDRCDVQAWEMRVHSLVPQRTDVVATTSMRVALPGGLRPVVELCDQCFAVWFLGCAEIKG